VLSKFCSFILGTEPVRNIDMAVILKGAGAPKDTLGPDSTSVHTGEETIHDVVDTDGKQFDPCKINLGLLLKKGAQLRSFVAVAKVLSIGGLAKPSEAEGVDWSLARDPKYAFAPIINVLARLPKPFPQTCATNSTNLCSIRCS
jgi:hypothetical protein